MMLGATLAVLVGPLTTGCQSPGSVVRGTNPDLEGESTRLRSVMAAGSLETTFQGITTVGFSDRFAVPALVPEGSETEPPAEPPAAAPTERERLGAAIAEQIKAFFTEAGYEWVEEGPPQRTIEFAWFLSESDGLPELDELSRIAPGIPDLESLERGMLVLAVSWPGRAAPIFRVSIDRVGRLNWPLESKLEAIPGSLERLLTGLPRGPVERVPEPVEGPPEGPVEGADSDPDSQTSPSPGEILGLDRADGPAGP